MFDQTTSYFFLGSVCGFGLFVSLLESKGMGSILFREGVFTPHNLIKYVKSPFNSVFLWYPQLWRHNWVIMAITGGFIGYYAGNFIGKFTETVSEAKLNSTVFNL
jgi:hypothetical protein